MADHSTLDPQEEKYRKESRWLAFKSQTWGALGMASFFAALGTLANGLMGFAAKTAGVKGLGMIEGAAGMITSPATLAVMGGLVAVGVACNYMSQHESTELRIIQDEHMAQQQAKCMKQEKAPAVEVEHEQNCRADGKSWSDVVANQNIPNHAAAR
jgi:hypothetical protein